MVQDRPFSAKAGAFFDKSMMALQHSLFIGSGKNHGEGVMQHLMLRVAIDIAISGINSEIKSLIINYRYSDGTFVEDCLK